MCRRLSLLFEPFEKVGTQGSKARFKFFFFNGFKSYSLYDFSINYLFRLLVNGFVILSFDLIKSREITFIKSSYLIVLCL